MKVLNARTGRTDADTSRRRAEWPLAEGVRALLGRVSPKTWVVLGTVAVTALASTGLVAFAPEPDRRPVAETAVPVSSEVVSAGTFAPELHLYGRVETPNAASLTALVSATVAHLEASEGDRVAAGDVLVQLDETDARLLLRRREAELGEARAALDALAVEGADDRRVLAHQEALDALAEGKAERYRQLRDQGSIAGETLNAVLQERHAQAIALSRQRNLVQGFAHRLARAEAQRERAATALEEAKVALARTAIRAPFAGRVTRINVAPGELVSPGRTVAEIYDDGALEIRAQIPTEHLPALQQALAAGRKPPAEVDFGSHRASGELDRLAGAVAKGQSGVDGLVRLHAAATPPDLGRAVRLKLRLPPIADVFAVPVQAVYGQRRLFVIEDGLLAGVEVERLGATTAPNGTQKLLVRADALQNGTRILVSQLSNAVTGLRVSTAGQTHTLGRPDAVGDVDADA